MELNVWFLFYFFLLLLIHLDEICVYIFIVLIGNLVLAFYFKRVPQVSKLS